MSEDAEKQEAYEDLARAIGAAYEAETGNSMAAPIAWNMARDLMDLGYRWTPRPARATV